MKSVANILLTGGMAALALLGGANRAQAIPITPVVSDWTLAAVTVGGVPDPADPTVPVSDTVIDIQPSPAVLAAAAKTVSNLALGGAETADGRAEVSIDPLNINQSVVKARSKLSAASTPNPSPGLGFGLVDASIGGLSARLSTVGLAPGETATVNLLLNVTGSLIYLDPGGSASGASICDPFDTTVCEIVPDMSASVSVILALADVTFDDPALPPFVPLFDGSVTLESTSGGGTPTLVREGDWADPARLGDFTFGACNPVSCQVDINISLMFTDVQSLGFGDTFDVGLLLLTGADALSDPGRTIEANFFDTASVEVTLAALPAAAPAPATLLLLAAGLMGMGAARRTRRLR